MIRAYYDATRQYDHIMCDMIKDIRHKLIDKEDDFLLVCCGPPCTGKSMLSLHIMQDFLGERANIKYIGLNKSSFAAALKESKEAELPRFVLNDEANISKRESLSRYNKDVIDLYLSIRGLRMFHWWNNPSLDMIDKHFIEERIKGVIFINDKADDRPRLYYYFRKIDLLRIWDKYGNLKIKLLSQIKKEYSYYRGWFRQYVGPLTEAYLDKKTGRMNDKIDHFFERYSSRGEEYMIADIARLLKISSPSASKYINIFLKEQTLREGEHYNIDSLNRLRIKKDAVPLIESEISMRMIENKKNRSIKCRDTRLRYLGREAD